MLSSDTAVNNLQELCKKSAKKKLEINECVGLGSFAAKNAIASQCPADEMYDKSRDSRSIAIYSNTVKIKLLS